MSDKERQSCCSFANFIRSLSIGKYGHGLFYKGKSHESSIFGGLLTAALSILLIIYAIYVLKNVVTRSEFTMYESTLNF